MSWRQGREPANHFWSLSMSEVGRKPRVSCNLNIPLSSVRGRGQKVRILAACLVALISGDLGKGSGAGQKVAMG